MFCLDIHNESVKALKYPSAESHKNSRKDKDTEEKTPGQGDKTLDEIIRDIQDEMEEDM